MSTEIDGISREKNIELTARIAAGLLASGHYTVLDEESGKCFLKYRSVVKQYAAVEDAELILDAIVGNYDKLAKLMSEE